jgi:hypothetical protein
MEKEVKKLGNGKYAISGKNYISKLCCINEIIKPIVLFDLFDDIKRYLKEQNESGKALDLNKLHEIELSKLLDGKFNKLTNYEFNKTSVSLVLLDNKTTKEPFILIAENELKSLASDISLIKRELEEARRRARKERIAENHPPLSSVKVYDGENYLSMAKLSTEPRGLILPYIFVDLKICLPTLIESGKLLEYDKPYKIKLSDLNSKPETYPNFADGLRKSKFNKITNDVCTDETINVVRVKSRNKQVMFLVKEDDIDRLYTKISPKTKNLASNSVTELLTESPTLPCTSK